MSNRHPNITAADVRAVKEIWETEVGRHVIKTLVERICRIDDPSIDPGDAGDTHKTAYREGQRYPAMVLRDMITLPIKDLIEEANDRGSNDSRSVSKRVSTARGKRKYATSIA